MNIDKEKAKIADQAAGQKEFLRQQLPDPKRFDTTDPEKMKLQVIRLAVESYVDDAEAEKKRLLDVVEVEKAKNRDIKDYAERLAMELERLSPGHPLAAEVLALLLENKMKSGQSPGRKKK